MSQSQDKTFLGTEPIGKLLLKLAIPTVVAQLVNMLYNIVDRIYIGHMPGDGALALTGVGVCMPVIMIISAFAAFDCIGRRATSVDLYGEAGSQYSRKDHWAAALLCRLSFRWCSPPCCCIWGRGLLMAFGASENTIEYAVDYMMHLRAGHDLCAADAGHERLHHRAGLCQHRHAGRYSSAR